MGRPFSCAELDRLAMLFRFGAAIALVVLTSVIGVALEKRMLELQRQVSRQYYRSEVLLERHAKLRLLTQQLGAPTRVINSMEQGDTQLQQPQGPVKTTGRRLPLLTWQRSRPASR